VFPSRARALITPNATQTPCVRRGVPKPPCISLSPTCALWSANTQAATQAPHVPDWFFFNSSKKKLKFINDDNNNNF